MFVRKDGTIYVADTKNERIAVFQEDGTFLTSYKKPDTPLLPKDFVYQPTKIAVDDRGYLYVAVRNGYQGLLLLDPEGQFDGFFGANRVDFTLTDSLKRLFYTKEQMQKELLKLPGSVSNVTRGPDGFVYTTSVSVKKGHIKKLNYDGKDLLGEKVYGSKNLKAQQQNQFTDITVDSRGYLTAIEAQFGTVYQYNSQGDLLFSFGAKDEGYQKLGLFKSPSSIAVNSEGVLYVLDRGSHLLQAFKATDFANKIHDAMDLYIQGQYEKGAGLWSEVLHLNTKYYRAHLGLAKAYYKQGRYEQAMNEYRMAGDVKGYSDAFWQVRLNWMQRHFTTLAGSLAAGIVILWLASRMAKRAAERRRSVETVKHPA
ncbi:tetratricopeptide repeat protein [Paenibacillus sp. CC-CFT747]|nr:tetratricopeptide repeat protein [Paenibacillus sp. CC-CFT747]